MLKYNTIVCIMIVAYVYGRDVNKTTGSNAKAPFLKAKACQLNPRPGQDQGHSWTRPIISA